jgi:hypothetical protein
LWLLFLNSDLLFVESLVLHFQTLNENCHHNAPAHPFPRYGYAVVFRR